jgi:lipopolysaccharide/colanic/teichoic acid biosynthesis glycosyltransferase
LEISNGRSAAVAPIRDRSVAEPWARAFDVVILAILSPLIVIAGVAIAVAIYVDSPGHVIFRSVRVGRGGRRFEMFKFRKMHAGAGGHPLTQADDERFTPIGRFLAATRLDELPQVWNVIRGEMRLVGPRPEIDCFVDQFADEYAEILSVTPGITGVAQLRFLDEKALLHGHDPATAYRDRVLPHKIEVDIDYVRTRSFAYDVAILGRTVLMPFVLALKWARPRSSVLRGWASAAGLAGVLVVMFVLSSSNIF